MDYQFTIDQFEGPLDLLLHLIKQDDINICDIEIVRITEQYFQFIHNMEEMNLNIASEYLIMAAELIEMKSKTLLPRPKEENLEDEFEEDPKQQLIQRLLEYQKYKEVTSTLKELEEERKEIHTKPMTSYQSLGIETEPKLSSEVGLDDLLHAFELFLERKELEKPLNTKITQKEYSVSIRSKEIRALLKEKRKIEFEELFDICERSYVIVTFLSILDLARKQELDIKQENNFASIYLMAKGSE